MKLNHTNAIRSCAYTVLLAAVCMCGCSLGKQVASYGVSGQVYTYDGQLVDAIGTPIQGVPVAFALEREWQAEELDQDLALLDSSGGPRPSAMVHTDTDGGYEGLYLLRMFSTGKYTDGTSFGDKPSLETFDMTYGNLYAHVGGQWLRLEVQIKQEWVEISSDLTEAHLHLPNVCLVDNALTLSGD